MKLGICAMMAAASLLAGPAMAATTVDWTTITGVTSNLANGKTTATGTINVGATTVNVTYTMDTSAVSFINTGSSGTNYWTEGNPAPYTGGQYSTNGSTYVAGETLADAPSDPSIVALKDNTLVTIAFDQAISNVYMGLVSWNTDGIANFSSPYSLVSSGQGYWGTGFFDNVSATGFNGNGELHGVVKFAGPISTLTFNALGTDNWHGILIGTEGLAPPVTGGVPEPATWAMIVGGLGLVGAAMRRRRNGLSLA